MIDFSLSREIYGRSPWCIDQETLSSLMAVLNKEITLSMPEIKYNTPSLLFTNKARVIDRPYGNSWYPGQLDNKEEFTGIGIIHLNGPITHSGGASSIGMKQLGDLMKRMASDERIISFVIIANSGGGSANAVRLMADTITEVNKIKPVYGFIEKGGTACSACYGILSACREIYAEDEMSFVGSCGTMIQFQGRAANTENEGVKYKRLYATKSTQKNIEFEEAINNDNYELIYSNLLDPMNEAFLKLIETNRPALKGTDYDTGKSIFTKDAVGTYIDGIISFDEILEIAEYGTKETPASTGTNPNINNVMTAEELKQKHPETYNSIFKAGAQQEQIRVKSWMVYADADLDQVKEGIKSGEDIQADVREELLAKKYQQKHIKDLEQDSPEPTKTPEAKTEGPKSDDEKELEAFNEELEKALK